MYDPIKMQYIYTEKGKSNIIQLTHNENLLLYMLYMNKGVNLTFEELSVFMYSKTLDKATYTKITTTKSTLMKKLKKHIKIITYNRNGYTLLETGEKQKNEQSRKIKWHNKQRDRKKEKIKTPRGNKRNCKKIKRIKRSGINGKN